MKTDFTLEELAAEVQEWCEAHGVVPASGQASDQLSERTIRYYRSLGLLDAAVAAAGARFTQKHRLQLIAVRLLQAQGLPLRQIRELLYGRSLRDLQEIERQGGVEARQVPSPQFAPSRREQWGVMPLTEDFMIVSRSGLDLPNRLLRRLGEQIREYEMTVTEGGAVAGTGKGGRR